MKASRDYPYRSQAKSLPWLILTASDIACGNIRFSMLFAAGDVSRPETSATQRQKFHADDVKYVDGVVTLF